MKPGVGHNGPESEVVGSPQPAPCRKKSTIRDKFFLRMFFLYWRLCFLQGDLERNVPER